MLQDRVESAMFSHAQARVWFAASTIFIVLLGASVFGGSAADPVGKLPLAETERVYIAKIETRALTLNQKDFPALARALRTGDVQQVQFFLAPAFKGEMLPLPETPNYQNDVLRIYRTSSGAKPMPGNLAAELFSFRKRFAKDAKVEIALMSLSPIS